MQHEPQRCVYSVHHEHGEARAARSGLHSQVPLGFQALEQGESPSAARDATKCDEAAAFASAASSLLASKSPSALATALALARILTLAGVLFGFAATLTLASILALAGMLAPLRIVELLRAGRAVEWGCATGVAVGGSSRNDS